MLTSLEIENFKGIGARQRIDFAPLTLLFGANSAGKSSILQALVYLHELVERGSADVDRTELGGHVLELGGFARLVHQHDTARGIMLRAEFATPGGLERFGRDLPDLPFPDLDAPLPRSTRRRTSPEAWEQIAIPEEELHRELEAEGAGYGGGSGAGAGLDDGSGFGDGRSLPVFALLGGGVALEELLHDAAERARRAGQGMARRVLRGRSSRGAVMALLAEYALHLVRHRLESQRDELLFVALDVACRRDDVAAALTPAITTAAKTAGLSVDVFLWDDIHDRYLITDLIGIGLQYGFGTTTKPNAQTTWHRLGRSDRDSVQREFDPAHRQPRHRFTVKGT